MTYNTAFSFGFQRAFLFCSKGFPGFDLQLDFYGFCPKAFRVTLKKFFK
jgi:hypothetical protein